MGEFKQKAEKCVNRALTLYDDTMELVLGARGMRTYYRRPDLFLGPMNAKFWHLEQDAFQSMLVHSSPFAVFGPAAVEDVVRARVHYHALRAAFVTFLCTLPTNWVMWPLMAVDIVFFQREVFLFSQEAVMLYKPRRDYLRRRPFHFDYVTLGVFVAKVMEPFVIRQTKTVIGVAGRFLFKRGIRFIRGPMQVAMRQGFKWCGVVVTREMVEGGIDLMVTLLCAVIAGFVSYWLFMPMLAGTRRVLAAEASAAQGTRTLHG
jgi:hypothetical protein